MYRGLYKSRSVKPKGTYKRGRRGRGKLPKPQEFAGQLQGVMRLKPNHKPMNKFEFEGFTKSQAITWGSSSIQQLSFKLSDMPNAIQVRNSFQRYRIKGCTCLVWASFTSTTADSTVPILLAPFKQKSSLNGATITSMDMVQGCQFKPLASAQDVLRCRIKYPVPEVLAVVSDTSNNGVFAGKGSIFLNADGINVPHYGFLVGFENEGALPSGITINYKLNIQFECYDFKFSTGLVVDSAISLAKAKDECPNPVELEGSVVKDVMLSEAIEHLDTLSSN